MVHNNLLSSGLTINHHLTDYEVDFVVTASETTIPIQACYDISRDRTKEREISSILKFWDEYHYLNSMYAFVVTNDYKGTEYLARRRLFSLPLMKFSRMVLSLSSNDYHGRKSQLKTKSRTKSADFSSVIISWPGMSPALEPLFWDLARKLEKLSCARC